MLRAAPKRPEERVIECAEETKEKERTELAVSPQLEVRVELEISELNWSEASQLGR